jgi:hypothetical protein
MATEGFTPEGGGTELGRLMWLNREWTRMSANAWVAKMF